jgi:hypothetical protein
MITGGLRLIWSNPRYVICRFASVLHLLKKNMTFSPLGEFGGFVILFNLAIVKLPQHAYKFVFDTCGFFVVCEEMGPSEGRGLHHGVTK